VCHWNGEVSKGIWVIKGKQAISPQIQRRPQMSKGRISTASGLRSQNLRSPSPQPSPPRRGGTERRVLRIGRSRCSHPICQILRSPSPRPSMNLKWEEMNKPPLPFPMASQARHHLVSPQETRASRYVVPRKRRRGRRTCVGSGPRIVSAGVLWNPSPGERAGGALVARRTTHHNS